MATGDLFGLDLPPVEWSHGFASAGRRVSAGVTVQLVLSSGTREDALLRIGRALADPTRCRIMLALLEGPGFPAQLAAGLQLSRSNVSNHLACLPGCGLVTASYQGRQVRYELADPHLTRALHELVDVVLAVEATVPCTDQHGAAASQTDLVARP